ncbi:bifunctional riboflavin kinase/FAD synthetase [Frigoribacterium faeni]|uniref:Riboflavin biosynthesis protein n=1 Tax=Frigoribacterium faeni TaxID=145483 RepID=A0A7W3JGW9_9MICO|nr:bifunctional riboflavin kinase/FAD synthetase [Frigoribacterium faeni]MBA8812599.1 riboflavin kinase/FMN adenylyltransferase [Frigoribacterium faeni]BFF13701.1 bifunctional riboflavin kinase/FAD synthetase [Microbacterium flavescens]GEK84621.1 riboflavin biosynthesis protein [Frigoribacterium faeni]
MQFWDTLADVPADFGPSAVTIGKFDGVHVGHRAVIDLLEEVAVAEGLTATVVTFDRHPLAVLQPDRVPTALVSNRQKRELLDQAGVAATLMLTFDDELRTLSPTDFVDRILVGALHARVVFVGDDFRFGVRGSGTVATLRELSASRGFRVVSIDDVRPGGDRRASSTWIRELLGSGRVREAAALLGRESAVRGVVVHGEQRGRELGFPTANLAPHSEGFVPADGVYAARVLVDDVVYPAAVSVGNNPTFDGVPAKQVEAHLLDVTLDLYGREVTVLFVDWVRGNVRFEGLEALIEHIAADVRRTREILGVPAPR